MNRFYWLILAILLCATSLEAAITFDASTTLDGSATGIQSVAHTTAVQSNRFAFACIGSTNNVTYSSVTYNSVAMTEIATVLNTGDGATRVSAYGLAAPNTGSNTFAFTLSGASNFAATFSTYYGVDQSTPYDSPSTDGAGGAATASSIDITSQINDVVLNCLTLRNRDFTLNTGASQTDRADVTYMASGVGPHTRVTEEAGVNGTVTMSMDWSGDGFEYFAHIAVNVNQFVSATTAAKRPGYVFE